MIFFSGVRVLICFLIHFTILLFFASDIFALHPLITEDTGVQGKGKTEIEIGGEYSRESEDGTAQKTSTVTATTAYGINDSMDLIIGAPFQNIRTKTEDSVASEDGLSDLLIELKWKFYDKDGLSLALKPSITLPTGDERRGLGNGRATYGIYFITTKEIDPVTLHFNLQYKRNENKTDSRLNIWHASIASEYKATEKLRLVANAGIDTNTSKESKKSPAYLLGGIVYSPSKDFDIDIGYKHGLNKPAADSSVLAGITYRF